MKKYLLNILLMVFFSVNISICQWSTDPNNNLIVGYGEDPHICSDSTGGCYITYNNNISYPRKLVLERINKYGYKSWNTNKEITGELPEQWQTEIIEDGEGGVIVGYEDSEWTPPFLKSRVRVQKIDSSGNLLWGLHGIRVSLQELDQGNIRIVNDGNGGCIVVWNQELSDYTYEYRANSINHLGERTWSDSGIFIVNSGSSEPASIVKSIDGNYYVQYSNIYRINQYGQILNQYYGNMLGQPVPDSEGGIILSGMVWTGMIPKLVAQRKDSLGNNLWQEPYIEIADSLDINTLLNIKYNNGYFYYSWTGKQNGVDKVAQFKALRLDGTKLYPNGSLPISNYPIDATLGGILPSDSNSVIFIWEYFRPDDGVFGQRIDTLGNKLWDTSDVRLYAGAYADLFTTTDGNGGVIGLGWHQYDFSLRMFKVSKNGIMGEVITNIYDTKEFNLPDYFYLYQNYPNPFNSSTQIKFSVPRQTQLKIDLYNILGELLQTITEGLYEAGYYQTEFDAQNLPSGVYIYRMEGSEMVHSRKMIILK